MSALLPLASWVNSLIRPRLRHSGPRSTTTTPPCKPSPCSRSAHSPASRNMETTFPPGGNISMGATRLRRPAPPLPSGLANTSIGRGSRPPFLCSPLVRGRVRMPPACPPAGKVCPPLPSDSTGYFLLPAEDEKSAGGESSMLALPIPTLRRQGPGVIGEGSQCGKVAAAAEQAILPSLPSLPVKLLQGCQRPRRLESRNCR